MKELVLIPTFQRTEFLYCALEAIRATEDDIPIHVFPDRGTNETEVCEKFGAIHHLGISHTYHGNSFVMLSALQWAATQSVGIVYVVEDDAIISPDFFQWCRAALIAKPLAFAACGWRYSPDAIISDGPDLLIPWYLSVCAAIPHGSLHQIVQHARPEYYSAMGSYLDSRYPNSAYRGSQHWEQDGLCLRVMESQSKRCVWPRRPRATHIGFHGYHQPNGQRLSGTLEDRVAVVRLAATHPEILAAMMAGGSPPRIAPCSVCGRPLPVTSAFDRCPVCIRCYHDARPGLAVTATSHYYLSIT